MILWSQLLGLSIDKLVYCVEQGSLFHQNPSCTFINLPLVPVINLNNQRMVYHVITPNMILDCSHLPRPLIWFPSVIYLNISIAIVLMFFPPWYIIHIKYKRTTSLATVEIAKWNRKFYSKCFFPRTSYPWNSLLVSCSLLFTVFKNVNATSIFIFDFFEFCSFISHFPH